MGREPKQTFSKKFHTDDYTQKILKTTSHHIDANQNHNVISPHTYQNGYYQMDNK